MNSSSCTSDGQWSTVGSQDAPESGDVVAHLRRHGRSGGGRYRLTRLCWGVARLAECLQICVSRRTDLAARPGRSELFLPARRLSPDALLRVVHDHRLAFRINHVFAPTFGIDEGLAGVGACHQLSVRRAFKALLFLAPGCHPLTQLMREIDRAAKQGAEIVDRCPGILQVLPRRFNDIRQAFAVLTRFAHKFENQKIKETQGPQALKVQRHLPRLSLLKRGRAKILIYSTVCHAGRRMTK